MSLLICHAGSKEGVADRERSTAVYCRQVYIGSDAMPHGVGWALSGLCMNAEQDYADSLCDMKRTCSIPADWSRSANSRKWPGGNSSTAFRRSSAQRAGACGAAGRFPHGSSKPFKRKCHGKATAQVETKFPQASSDEGLTTAERLKYQSRVESLQSDRCLRHHGCHCLYECYSAGAFCAQPGFHASSMQSS